VIGRPAHLLALNVDEGTEVHTAVEALMDEELLQCRPGTVFSVRGTENQIGTVQYYELASYGVVAVSRPFHLLSFQQRIDWMRLLWTRLRPRGAFLAISGRELEVSVSDVQSGIRDWTTLRGVPLVELLVLSDSVVLGTPSDSIPIEHGFLVRLQSDESGGLGMH
jgi:hypothetical protein